MAATSRPVVAAGAAVGSRASGAGHAASPTAKLPLSARQLLADRRRHLAAQQPVGIVTGLALNSAGRPLMDVCVTAHGPSAGKFAATEADGRFVLGGLRPGKYQLEYRSCGGAAPYLTAWYGGSN